jgi:hypothetical protein
MNKLKLLVFSMVLACSSVFATDKVVQDLQDCSVTIRVTDGKHGGEGSGVIVTRNGTTYVMTAAHVVELVRNTRKVVDPKTGTPRYIISFGPVLILKDVFDGDRKVGSLTAEAEVIKYSDADFGEDVAILRVKKGGLLPQVSAKFYNDTAYLPVGTKLLHVGSMYGFVGSNSYTTGVLSQVGRVIEDKMFYQTNVVACPGSSGCGIFLEDGRYVGMFVRAWNIPTGFGYFTPIQRIEKWAKKTNALWFFDETVPLPTNFGDIELLEDAPPIVDDPILTIPLSTPKGKGTDEDKTEVVKPVLIEKIK